MIFGVVYAELTAKFARYDLDGFLESMVIRVDETLTRAEWHAAGTAFRVYQHKCQRFGTGQSKRFIADFIIGTHALHHANRLVTLDASAYRALFPKRVLLEP